MNITDNKFAAEIVTTQGKVFKFDSIECLFNYKHSAMDEKIKIHSEWVNDFSNPGQLIDLTKAHFLYNDVIRSPMGLNVLSFSSKNDLIKTQKEYGGKELTYNEVMELAIRE
jgi:copper chaperone NosL